MNNHQVQVKFKSLLLILTILSTSIFYSRVAIAHNQPEIARRVVSSAPLNAGKYQIAQASDTAGNWAEPFIQVLVQKGIIAGYPDGTFKPDRPVTRAEFAALLNKAFDLAPTKAASSFADVKPNFWGAAAIDKAYRAGFLVGYPNRTFKPNDHILRIESLVSIATGTNLQADGSANKVDELFTDAAQVPSFGRNALIAATQKCLAVSGSYPTGKTFDPAGVATRADVAAFIHQALVSAGKLPALASDSPAQQYIVNCAPVAPAPIATTITEQDVLSRIGIGAVPTVDTTAPTVVNKPSNSPVTGITTPSGFGANWGTLFVGAGYQDSLYPTALFTNGKNTTAFGLAAGFGLGNSRDFVGLETSYRTGQNDGGPNGSTNLGLFSRGSVNFKLHKQFGDNLAIAAGWENAIRNGYVATDVTDTDTFYGVVTGVLPVSSSNNFTASVGVGNGRFRSISDIFGNKAASNVFGSLGFRVSENIGLVADYNGRNMSVGLPLSVKLSDNIGLQIVPSILDVAGDKTAGEVTRFGIGGGLAVRF